LDSDEQQSFLQEEVLVLIGARCDLAEEGVIMVAVLYEFRNVVSGGGIMQYI